MIKYKLFEVEQLRKKEEEKKIKVIEGEKVILEKEENENKSVVELEKNIEEETVEQEMKLK